MKLEGYVIVQPPVVGNNKPNPHPHTFASKPGLAWKNHIGHNHKQIDESIVIQWWHDRGYRVKKATLEVEL